jgi:hypothetical protein
MGEMFDYCGVWFLCLVGCDVSEVLEDLGSFWGKHTISSSYEGME